MSTENLLRAAAGLAANLGQLPPVVFEHGQSPQAVPHAVEQLAMEAGGLTLQGVVLPLAGLSHFDEPGTPKVGQMPRDLGLRHLQGGAQVADADFSLQQQAEQAQAGRIREGAKEQVGGGKAFRHIHISEYVIRKNGACQRRARGRAR